MKAAQIQNKRIVSAVLAFALAVQLAPVWSFKYFPSQDGPAHLENAALLRDYWLGRRPAVREFYQLNDDLDPNWSGHVVLAGLMCVVSPLVAEKVLLSLYVVGLPLSAAYAAGGFRRGGEWAGVLVLPFVYSLALHKGLYNFCLSLILYFLLVGFIVRERRRLWVTVVGVLVLSILLYFSHVVSLVMAYGTIVCVIVRRGSRWREIPWIAVGLAPAAGMTLAFFARSGHNPVEDRGELIDLLRRLAEIDALVSFKKVELALAATFALIIFSLLIVVVVQVIRNKSFTFGGLLIAATGAVAIYLVTPNTAAGGGQISFRLSLFPWFLLILWLATQTTPRWMKNSVMAASIIVSIALIGVRWPTYARINVLINEYVSVRDHVKPGSTIVSLDLSREGTRQRSMAIHVRPFWHALGYVAAKRDVINLGNYEAALGYFPVVYRRASLRTPPPDAVEDEAHFAATVGADQVIVWNVDPKYENADQEIIDRLAWNYYVVYQSPNGLAKVYRRKARG